MSNLIRKIRFNRTELKQWLQENPEALKNSDLFISKVMSEAGELDEHTENNLGMLHEQIRSEWRDLVREATRPANRNTNA